MDLRFIPFTVRNHIEDMGPSYSFMKPETSKFNSSGKEVNSMAKENPQEDQLKCSSCGKTFKSESELREHERACPGRQQGKE
jgi:hypothetical protein